MRLIQLRGFIFAALSASMALSGTAIAGETDTEVTATSGNTVQTSTLTGEGWKLRLNGGLPTWDVLVAASFDKALWTAWFPSIKAIKLHPGTNGALSPIVPGLPDLLATAQATATTTGDAGIVIHEYTFILKAHAIAPSPAAPPPSMCTRAAAWYRDPLLVLVGAADSTLGFSQSLKAGSQIMAAVDGEDPFTLVLAGRFGIGEFSNDGTETDPELLWPEDGSLPGNAMDLYRIEISENALGNIESDVTLYSSSDPDYLFSFNQTAAAIEGLLEAAVWNDSGDVRWLDQDQDLLEASITCQTNDNLGISAAVGAMLQNDAFAESDTTTGVIRDSWGSLKSRFR